MNLIEQFPDISMKIREKSRRRQQKYLQHTPIKPVAVDQEKTRAKYYNDEFRRWHFKLMLIIIVLLGSIYLLILNSPWMFSLINAVRSGTGTI